MASEHRLLRGVGLENAESLGAEAHGIHGRGGVCLHRLRTKKIIIVTNEMKKRSSNMNGRSRRARDLWFGHYLIPFP